MTRPATAPAVRAGPGSGLPAVPRGFRLGALHCGIKSDPAKSDLVLIATEAPAAAAGVYTTTRMPAAPVIVDRARTPAEGIRAVVVNSGNANACTGERGIEDALATARIAAAAVGARPEQALVLSTGIIGRFLPMDRIRAGLAALEGGLDTGPDALLAAARGIMTTDTVPKVAGRTAVIGSAEVRVTGFAKGAAMIGPNLATMLAVVMTDAGISARLAQELLASAADDSFNCISVDGHQSTNDSVLFLASGAAGGPRLDEAAPRERAAFRAALHEVCRDLARAIPADGEGATHLVTIDVIGGRSRDDARRIARCVADSPLVKTAIAGADPNWGRIISALGNAGVAFDPAGVELELNGTLLFRGGGPVPFDGVAVSASIRDHRETSIVLRLRDGDAAVRFWTTDLTAEYVRLNAEYTT
jgi:glutamate N-acetyltransferase/amino-acid N-acetyltransferase